MRTNDGGSLPCATRGSIVARGRHARVHRGQGHRAGVRSGPGSPCRWRSPRAARPTPSCQRQWIRERQGLAGAEADAEMRRTLMALKWVRSIPSIWRNRLNPDIEGIFSSLSNPFHSIPHSNMGPSGFNPFHPTKTLKPNTR